MMQQDYSFTQALFSLREEMAEIHMEWLFLALAVGAVLSFLIRAHFRLFSNSISNRHALESLFPFLILTVTLVIMIVKSSLALSLGLVGALSIVRFRTPIKEPEELAYVFLCIAVGLGLGADRVVLTIFSTLTILVITTLWKLFLSRKSTRSQTVYLSIQSKKSDSGTLEKFTRNLESFAPSLRLQRVDSQPGGTIIVYILDALDQKILPDMMDGLRSVEKDATFHIVDAQRLPSL